MRLLRGPKDSPACSCLLPQLPSRQRPQPSGGQVLLGEPPEVQVPYFLVAATTPRSSLNMSRYGVSPQLHQMMFKYV